MRQQPHGLAVLALMTSISTPVPAASSTATSNPAIRWEAVASAPSESDPPAGYTVESWTIADGLPVNAVGMIRRGRDGYLWLATFDGLVRFDGVRFTTFNVANTAAMTSDRIISLLPSRSGAMWVATMNGGVLRAAGSSVERLANPSSDPHTQIIALHEDETGVLWVGQQDGLFRSSGTVLEPYRHDLIQGSVGAIHHDRRGRLWTSSAGGLVVIEAGRGRRVEAADGLRGFFETASGRIFVTTYGPNAEVIENRVESVRTADLAGENIVASGTPSFDGTPSVAQLERFVDDNLAHNRFPGAMSAAFPASSETWFGAGIELFRDGTRVYTAPSAITSIHVDDEGSVWFGTVAHGLQRLRPALVTTIGGGHGADAANLYGVCETRDGTIWMARWSGPLLRQRGSYLEALRGYEKWEHDIYCVGEDTAGQIYLGCLARGLWRQQGTRREPVPLPGAHSDDVYFIRTDRQGDLWVGTNAGLYVRRGSVWARHREADGALAWPVRAFCEARDGSLWFGTNGGGVARMQNGQFESLGERDGLASDLVRTLYEDSTGVMWIGTESRGLSRVDARGVELRTAALKTIRQSDGLYDEGIHQILEDDLGRFWMSTNRGIFFLRREELEAFTAGRVSRVQSTAFTERDGMRNRECNGGAQPAGIRAHDGRLWFATQNGAVVVDPSRISPQPRPPRVAIEGILSSGQGIEIVASVARVASDQRDFELVYTGISLLSPKNVRFRYRLAGHDRDWVEAGERRTAFYTRVPPGRYRFEVSASTSGQEWPEPTSVQVLVVPRFFEATAFRFGVAVVLIFLGMLGYRERVRQVESRARDLSRIVDERTRELTHAKTESERARDAAEAARIDAEKSRDLAQQALITIESQAAALKELDAAKSRFFANVSHEFRTPLTLTIGPLEDALAGLHGPLSADATATLDLAVRNARRMLVLVNQLLDLAKLESGQMQLHARRCDPGASLRDIAETFRPLMARRRITLTIEIPADPIELWYDSVLLDQVIANLLTNAAKFTPEGGDINARLSRAAPAEGVAGVQFVVRDTGPGIAAEHLPRVFDRFYQVGSAGPLAYPGTGIGLALVREIVELHCGTVTASSAPDAGATFTVTLPLGRAHLRDEQIVDAAAAISDAVADGEAPAAVAASGPTEAGPDDAPTVLIVEDHDEVRAYLRRRLSERYRVLEAADGLAGLEIARRDLPDLVVSDVMMPGMDGFALCRAMKQDPELDFIPVILLTARASVESRVEGLQIGADDYLAKPFHAPELMARVQNLIALRQRLRERLRAETTSPARQDAVALLQPSPVKAVSVDEALLARLRAVLEAHHADEEFDVAEMARAVGMDRSHLYRRLQTILGRSPETVLQEFRLARAAQLLEQHVGSVGEIAYAAGYKNLSHFGKQFRLHFGVTPSQYTAQKGRADRTA